MTLQPPIFMLSPRVTFCFSFPHRSHSFFDQTSCIDDCRGQAGHSSGQLCHIATMATGQDWRISWQVRWKIEKKKPLINYVFRQLGLTHATIIGFNLYLSLQPRHNQNRDCLTETEVDIQWDWTRLTLDRYIELCLGYGYFV